MALRTAEKPTWAILPQDPQNCDFFFLRSCVPATFHHVFHHMNFDTLYSA